MGAYIKNAWLGFWTVLVGMRVTLKYLLSPAITLQYPDQRWEIPEGARGKLDTDIDDCIGCLACARACPVECITIKTRKPPKGLDMGKTSEGTKKKLVVPQFDIDISTCLYCGLCVEACPTGCIRMTKDYEYSTYDRSTDLLLLFGKDLDPAVEAAAIERAKQIEEEEKAEAAKKAAEAPEKPDEAAPPEKKTDTPEEPPKKPSTPGDSEAPS
jgi:NADH-quinone oxidoreductase subunit I